MACLSCAFPGDVNTAKIMELFGNYPSNKLLYAGNIALFGGVILGSNPSGVARVKGLRLTWAEQLIPKIAVE